LHALHTFHTRKAQEVGKSDWKKAAKHETAANEAHSILSWRKEHGKSLEEGLTPRERMSGAERLKPKEKPPVDRGEAMKKKVTSAQSVTAKARKTQAVHKTVLPPTIQEDHEARWSDEDRWGYTPKHGNTQHHQLQHHGWQKGPAKIYTHPEHKGHSIAIGDPSGKFTHTIHGKHIHALSPDLTSHLEQFHGGVKKVHEEESKTSASHVALFRHDYHPTYQVKDAKKYQHVNGLHSILLHPSGDWQHYHTHSQAGHVLIGHGHGEQDLHKELSRVHGHPASLDEAYGIAFDESGGSDYKVGDKVVAKIGPHKGQVHRVIHVHPTGHLNIKPDVHVSKNKYHLGAAKADPKDVERAPVSEESTKRAFYANKQEKDPAKFARAKHPNDITREKVKASRDWGPWGSWGVKKGVNSKTVQEAFQTAKDKKNGKQDNLPQSGEGANEPGKEKLNTPNPEPQPQDGAAPMKQQDSAPEGQKPGGAQSNAPKPEASNHSKKLVPKGKEQFQAEPYVTPLTTMPDTASPKSGSQGVR
jgi:hypothetical protein